MSEDNSFQETLQSEVVPVICNGCGSEQVMNKVYAAYVKDGLQNCRNCRNCREIMSMRDR